jgi:hypothetical protein
MSTTWNFAGLNDPEPIPDDYVWERLRNRRNELLAATDWRVLPDAPGDTSAWVAYRQALRDLPSTTADPRTAAWPTEPS